MSERALLLLLFLLCSGDLIAQTTIEKHIQVDGYDRKYFVYSPKGIDPSKKYPLIMVLHGGGGSAERIINFCGFNALADKEKFIVMYPDGYKKGWHDGRIAPDVDANKKDIDDVKFISTAIDQVQAGYPIDADRIFSTGISNGAMMSLHLAYKLSERLRGIAPVCGSIAENMAGEFKPARPLAVLIINGTEDKLVRYEGGPVLSERADRGTVVSTDKMIQILMKMENMKGTVTREAIPDKDPSDNCQAELFKYPSSATNPIELIRITGGGHTWPGGKQYLPKMIVGKVCRDFKAEVVIWDFFKNLPPR